LVSGALRPLDSSSEDESSLGEPGADEPRPPEIFLEKEISGSGKPSSEGDLFHREGIFQQSGRCPGRPGILVSFGRRATLRSGEAGGSRLVSGSCPGFALSSEREDLRWRPGFNSLRPSGSSSEEPDYRGSPIVHESWTLAQRSSFGDFGKVGSHAIRQCPGRDGRGGLLRKSASAVREGV